MLEPGPEEIQMEDTRPSPEAGRPPHRGLDRAGSLASAGDRCVYCPRLLPGTENVSGKVRPRAQDLQGLDGLRDLTVVGWTSQPNWRSTWRVWAVATETPVTVQLCVWGREDEVIEVLEAPSHRPRRGGAF